MFPPLFEIFYPFFKITYYLWFKFNALGFNLIIVINENKRLLIVLISFPFYKYRFFIPQFKLL